ncbi:class I SAM-dependent methyltransferase [Shewanella sp. SG44-2]|uniref:class I SAM-dependent methyltransferase n=1 Tax=Shewanella sp. SG44-2 TaxID=2760962 RepID=UPI001603AC57|nr:class I SAM-dependent methyltransferase [Shewanella sp. SG44-2]MBB1428726.1 class I SAM-dependent methyltransferase [Shewanella sp. SG44-2]
MDSFEELKSVWEDIFTSLEWGKYPNEDIIRFVARNFYKVENRSKIKILEVGSGTGANLWYISREGFSCYGLEGSDSGVARSISRLNEEVPNWSGAITQGDLTSLPYKDCTFDAVIDNQAIYCNSFENSEKAYAEIYRVLKNEGQLYTRTFTTDTTGYRSGKKIGYNMYITQEGPLKDRGPVRFSSEKDIRDLLSLFNIKDFDRITRGYGTSDIVSEWSIIASK